MATRFYLPSTAAAAVSPTPSAVDWEHVNTASREMDTTKLNTSASGTAYAPDGADHIANGDAMIVQYVSKPLAAQTISAQTVGVAIPALEANAGNELSLAWKVYVVDNAGTTVRGTLVAIQREGVEVGTVSAQRFDSATSSSLAISANDRLVLELGLGGTPIAAGGVQGHNGTLTPGDSTTADLSGVDGGPIGATLASWLNFGTDTITFAGGGPATLTATADPSVLLALAPSGFKQALGTGAPSVLLALAPAALQVGLATAAPSVLLALAPAADRAQPATTAPSILLALAPAGIRLGVAVAAPSVLLALAPAASATFGDTASPSILLSLAPNASATLGATAAASILLQLAPSALDIALGQAAPSILLALAASGARAQPATASPSVLLALAPSALDLALAQAAPSIRLAIVPSAFSLAQAAPSILLALAPSGRLTGLAQAAPSIALALAPSGLWVARAQATPSVLLGLAPSAARVVLGAAAPSILLALVPTAVGLLEATSSPAILLAFLGIDWRDIATVYLVYNASDDQGLIEQGLVTGFSGISNGVGPPAREVTQAVSTRDVSEVAVTVGD